MALSTNMRLDLKSTLSSALDLVTSRAPLDYSAVIDLASGTGANQADRIFADTRTLAASATEDLDLAGVLSDPLGASLTFARIKAVLIRAAAGNTNSVNVTRPASNGVPLFLAASDGLAVRPGGLFLWVAPDATGVAVTAGTGDLLTLTNSAGSTSVTYDVIIIGASA
ncbi:hypothetical protein QBA57_28595 [Streptomyces scabiei]|uniref:hypothetical protein n=1 Tax=Streptomyces scabiei TaxID=1930 RepID=UPI001B34033D|nr:hypothetical protein [Streptomyces scabiei]MBP5931829.1 hypothetical protein [Streptomyces sp. LBUM 1479]MDX2626812.1 hypothetical protein [Streptomyces scabiei]MDX3028269.1 hypothetical protein [Streptomyces scabiei]MDX3162749.1 hypothetical protein [Streptomyces scabiei]